jgi:hypothetical protein
MLTLRLRAVHPCVWGERGGHIRRPGPPWKVSEFSQSPYVIFSCLLVIVSTTSSSTRSYGFHWPWHARVSYMFRYCVCFDPLDGSSNIDCGVSIGTVSVIITFIFFPPAICNGKWVKRDEKERMYWSMSSKLQMKWTMFTLTLYSLSASAYLSRRPNPVVN